METLRSHITPEQIATYLPLILGLGVALIFLGFAVSVANARRIF